MNRTASRTSITISTTNANASNKTAIRKRIEFDRFGRQHIVETVRGIRI
jgi:hypothetical protein